MILDKEEIDQRLASPLNLLNRLRSLTGQTNQIISIPKSVSDESSSSHPENHPSLPPSIDELVGDVHEKLATARCRSGAKEVLSSAIEGLKLRVFEVDDPVKLSHIATDMSKIVNGFDEAGKGKGGSIIPIVYRPIMLVESNFQVIQAND